MVEVTFFHALNPVVPLDLWYRIKSFDGSVTYSRDFAIYLLLYINNIELEK